MLQDLDALYTEILFGEEDSESSYSNYEVIGFPGQVLKETPQKGDLMIRVALGEPGLGHIDVLSDSVLWEYEELAATSVRMESKIAWLLCRC